MMLKAAKNFKWKKKNFSRLIRGLILQLRSHFHQYKKPEFNGVIPDL